MNHQTAKERPIYFNGRCLLSPMSGVPRVAHELAKHLGDRVIVIKPKRELSGIIGHLWEQLVLPWKVRGGVLLSPANTGPLLVKRQVVIIHDAATFDMPEAFTGLFARWYRWLLPRLAKRVATVVTVSKFSRGRLALHLGIPEEKIQVVYNGVTPPELPVPASTIKEVKAKYRIEKPYFLFVGSNDPRKNMAFLIAAFEKAELARHELLVVGGSLAHVFAESGSTKVGNGVRYLGRVSDRELCALYTCAVAFVFPSLYEGFGLPPLEAMAHGCPVLCSDAAALVEICKQFEPTGKWIQFFSPTQQGELTLLLRVTAGEICNKVDGAHPATGTLRNWNSNGQNADTYYELSRLTYRNILGE